MHCKLRSHKKETKGIDQRSSASVGLTAQVGRSRQQREWWKADPQHKVLTPGAIPVMHTRSAHKTDMSVVTTKGIGVKSPLVKLQS